MKHYFQLPNGVINDINRKGKAYFWLFKDNIHVGRNIALTILK